MTTADIIKGASRSLTDRQRRFAEFVAAGETKIKAFSLAGYSSTGETAQREAATLMKRPGVKAYLEELRKPQRESAIATRQRKRELLFEIMEGRIPGTTVADMIRAIQVDNLMTGDNKPIKVEGEITLKRVLDEIDAKPTVGSDYGDED